MEREGGYREGGEWGEGKERRCGRREDRMGRKGKGKGEISTSRSFYGDKLNC